MPTQQQKQHHAETSSKSPTAELQNKQGNKLKATPKPSSSWGLEKLKKKSMCETVSVRHVAGGRSSRVVANTQKF